jgi:hypothetical protein
MTDQHPIVPSFEMANQWHKEACKDPYNGGKFMESKTLKYIATKAAQWGADQELDACCGEVSFWGSTGIAKKLRDARRPRPPSLKEQALALLQPGEPRLFNNEMQDTIRRALEALPND